MLLLPFENVAAFSDKITVEVNVKNDVVEVCGENFEKENQLVSITMFSPQNSLVYIDDCVSALDGTYKQNIKMSSELPSGLYYINVKSALSNAIETKQFYFSNTYFYNVAATISNEKLLIYGNIKNCQNKSISAVLTNESLIKIAETTMNVENETFQSIIALPQNMLSGVYKLTLTCAENDVSYTCEVVYNSTLDINKVTNESLYQALKKANPQLDTDENGIITNEELANLTGTLDLGGMGINNIEGLQNCVNLKCLYLENNYIQDLSPLSNLKKLEQLDASNNQLSECILVSPVLKVLNLDNNDFVSIPNITNCVNLEVLFLSHNSIVNVSEIGANNKLKVLTLNDNEIVSLNGLEMLGDIEHLDLGFNLITDISPLENMGQLQFLNLSNNEIVFINRLPQNRFRNLFIDNNRIDLENEENQINHIFAFNKVYSPQK